MPTPESTISSTQLLITNSTSGSGGQLNYEYHDYNIYVIALSVIQNEVTPDCRRIATLLLSGFLVVGILCKVLRFNYSLKEEKPLYMNSF